MNIIILDADSILPSVSTKRTREDETTFKKLAKSNTKDNLKLKTTIVESGESDLEDSESELNATTDKLNRTHLDSGDDVSEHEIETIEKKRKPVTKTFKITKPEYPYKLNDYTDANGFRYYADKISNIEVIVINYYFRKFQLINL